MKFLSLLLSVSLVSVSAFADLKSTFKSLENSRKGPFSLNYMQGTLGRVAITESETPPGEFLFQAAFRNDIGKELATKYDFYTANLFSTNYYELTGTYVYNDTYGSFALNQEALIAAGPQAITQAASMVRHWVLEKHYVTFFPNTATARGFKLRGISGAEFEQVYATYFFNFYLSAMTEDYQFLPAYLLAKSSPITESSALEKARTLIATTYDAAKLQFGEKTDSVRSLYQIRNTIHNQLSQDVITQIDVFSRNYPELSQFYSDSLYQVQSILRSYYSVSSKRISDLAKAATRFEVQAAADQITVNGNSIDRILALSLAIANLRTDISNKNSIAINKKTASLVLMASASQYLNKEISALNNVNSKNAVKAVINLLYAEGFLIKDNWEYFVSEVDAAASVKDAAALIPDVTEIANDTLLQAFNPALDQWLSVEPKMQYFIDNTIKSSSLNTASILSKKIK